MDKKLSKKQKLLLDYITKPDPKNLKKLLKDKDVNINFIYTHRYSLEGDTSDFIPFQILCLEHDLHLEDNDGKMDSELLENFNDCAEILLKSGTDFKYKDSNFKEMPIDQALQTGNIKILKMTIEQMKLKNILFENNPILANYLTFLYYNIEIRPEFTEEKIIEVIKTLLETNIDLNMYESYFEQSAIQLLAELKNENSFEKINIDSIIKVIIHERGSEIDFDCPKDKGKTPRKILCDSGFPEKTIPDKLKELFKCVREFNLNEFKNNYTMTEYIDEEKSEVEFFALIKLSIQEGCTDIFKFLLEYLKKEKGYKEYAEKNNMYNIMVEKCCLCGYADILEKLLDNFYRKLNIDILTSILWDLVKQPPDNSESETKKINHDKCFEKILNYVTEVNEKFNINKLDYYEKPILYYSLKNKQDKMSLQLLKNGASLICPQSMESNVFDIDADLLLKYLNGCIEKKDESENRIKSGVRKERVVRKKGEYHIDITSLLPENGSGNKTEETEEKDISDVISTAVSIQTETPPTPKVIDGNVQEMSVLEYISSDTEYRKLLLHPVLNIFLTLKWHKIRYFFYFELFIYIIYTILLFIYLMVSTVEATDAKVVLYYFLIVYFMFILLWEITQMVMFHLEYFKFFDNWLNLTLLILSFIIIIIDSYNKEMTHYKKPLYAISSIILFINIFYMSVNFPMLTTNVIMLRTVYETLFKFLLNYLLLLLAFASGFYILFHNTKEKLEEGKTDYFSTLGLSFFKTFMMLTGEYESEDMSFDSYPVTSHIIFLLFIILISVGMLNLLTGLAVSDIQMIRSEAIIFNKKLRVEQVSRLEKIWLNDALIKGIPMLCRYVQRIFLLTYPGDKETKIIINPVSKTVKIKNLKTGEMEEIRNIVNDKLLTDIENKDKFSLE